MKVSIGCYVEGRYQTADAGCARVVRLAESYGMALDRDTENFCRRMELDCPRAEEFADEFSQEAENWLNENHGLAYAWWGWNDGSFGLWPDVDGAKFECEFVGYEPPADFEGEWLHVNDHGNCTLCVRADGKDTELWSLV